MEYSSVGTASAFHSWEPRNAIARSRPSCSTSTRRVSEELKPRALTLKSFIPLWEMSTPGTSRSASGAWPVIPVDWSTRGSTTLNAAGASTARSGTLEAPVTVSSESLMGDCSSFASTVVTPLAVTLAWTVSGL